jgi:hypothetical protein
MIDKKRKCCICRIILHESCIEKLADRIKCRITFKESDNYVNRYKEEFLNIEKVMIHQHHWLFYQYKQSHFNNHCKICSKAFIKPLDIDQHPTIISCSWCKIPYHFKCFSLATIDFQCDLGKLCRFTIPPSWITMSPKKQVQPQILVQFF